MEMRHMRASRANKGVRPADSAIRDAEADIYQSKDWAEISVNVEEGTGSGSGGKDRRMMAAMGKKQQLTVSRMPLFCLNWSQLVYQCRKRRMNANPSVNASRDALILYP